MAEEEDKNVLRNNTDPTNLNENVKIKRKMMSYCMRGDKQIVSHAGKNGGFFLNVESKSCIIYLIMKKGEGCHKPGFSSKLADDSLQISNQGFR